MSLTKKALLYIHWYNCDVLSVLSIPILWVEILLSLSNEIKLIVKYGNTDINVYLFLSSDNLYFFELIYIFLLLIINLLLTIFYAFD